MWLVSASSGCACTYPFRHYGWHLMTSLLVKKLYPYTTDTHRVTPVTNPLSCYSRHKPSIVLLSLQTLCLVTPVTNPLSCYSRYKPSIVLLPLQTLLRVTPVTNPPISHEWGRKGSDYDYNKQNISMVICDRYSVPKHKLQQNTRRYRYSQHIHFWLLFFMFVPINWWSVDCV
jgi:hypothetical protein